MSPSYRLFVERISDSDMSVITASTIPSLTKFLGECLVTVHICVANLMTVWLSVLCVCVCVCTPHTQCS